VYGFYHLQSLFGLDYNDWISLLCEFEGLLRKRIRPI
jgi:hypothetical protein